MKKLLQCVAMVCLLSACSSNAFDKKEAAISVTMATVTESKAETSVTTATVTETSVATSTTTESKVKMPNTLTAAQQVALENGMKAFGEKMNQVPYVKTDVPNQLTWQAGWEVSGYTIYESYIYQSGTTTHRYFFVTNANGTPEVLYSTGGTSVKRTANADIAAMFVAVYNGQ